MMTVLGIDINRSGAAPLLDESGASLDDKPKGRPAVNAALLAGNIAHASATHGYVEHVGRGSQRALCRALFSGIAKQPNAVRNKIRMEGTR